MMLIIQPFGHIEDKVIKHLQKGLAPYFEKIQVNEEMEILDEAYNAYRKQYLVDTFMEILRGIEGKKVLGVVDRDLYSPEMNFVFGQGRIHGRYAIISIERLRESVTKKWFLDRVLKEAIHELGHTWGLHHCTDKSCVMRFSDTLGETDIKSSAFCKTCEEKLD